MIRRRFMQLMTLAGAGTFQAVNAAAKSGQVVATYKITGFSCITCAVGLDTMMEREKGVVWSKSSYPKARTSICYHPDLATDIALRCAIGNMGFQAQKLS